MVKFSVYLNRHVFVMYYNCCKTYWSIVQVLIRMPICRGPSGPSVIMCHKVHFLKLSQNIETPEVGIRQEYKYDLHNKLSV